MPTKAQRRQQEARVFHLFGRLPLSLIHQIWKYSWQPRTIALYPISNTSFLRPGTENCLPVSAYVNAESRGLTLMYYERAFAHWDKSAFRWFNFEIDSLCLATEGTLEPLEFYDPDDLRRIRRLIVPCGLAGLNGELIPCHSTWPKPVSESLSSPYIRELRHLYFPSLEEITLVTQSWSVYKGEDGSYIYDLDKARSIIPGGGWGHMRTTTFGRLRVRHSIAGRKTYHERYCRRLSKLAADILEDEVSFYLNLSLGFSYE
ncbi:hypothetical protein ONZ43_g4449 [Nemania bipapillata]|uniref:Uncharacterized protein n=1 Tax=Nemania bipapillata TaxID=110536 RepID=A0ACC2IMN3_9PEZI|nr:hypothetical protein ONZ43_g4449 [Nemania bipapillata]